MKRSRVRLIALAASLVACTTVPLGSDPFEDASTIAPTDDAGPRPDGGPRADTGTTSSARAPLDPDFFYCRVQPEVIARVRCASPRGCHASNTSMRLVSAGETDAPPSCTQDHPTGPVPASYYTNLARARAETRVTARQSDLYWRPLGHSHDRLFDETSAEAQLLRAWIEGTAP